MTRMVLAAVVPVAALGLAACSGGGAVSRAPTIPPGEEATRVFSEGTGDLGDAISTDQTLTARSVGVAGIDLEFGGGPTALRTGTTAAIRRNADGELTVTMDGVDHAFTPADRVVEPGGEVYGYSVDDGTNFYDVFSESGEIDEFLTPGTGYAKVLNISSDRYPGQPFRRAFAVFGTETRDAALAGLPTANFLGYARIDAYPETGFINSSTNRWTYNGDVAMTADFGAGSISGSITNLTQRLGDGPDDPIAGSIAMNAAPFTVNAYRGTLTPDAGFRTAAGISSASLGYSGAFYGNAAEETAGTISGRITATGGSQFNSIGFFLANR